MEGDNKVEITRPRNHHWVNDRWDLTRKSLSLSVSQQGKLVHNPSKDWRSIHGTYGMSNRGKFYFEVEMGFGKMDKTSSTMIGVSHRYPSFDNYNYTSQFSFCMYLIDGYVYNENFK